jgi:hypothetical protein
MVTCLHYYNLQIFNEVLDINIGEMNNRFGETSTRYYGAPHALILETHLADLIMTS